MLAIDREWALTEDGSDIAALIAAGEKESALRVLREWSRLDPKKAAEVAAAISSNTELEQQIVDEVLEKGIAALLKTDPGQLLSKGWIEKLSGENFNSFSSGDLKSLSATEIGNALQTLSTVSNRWMRERFAAPFLEKWAEQEPVKALRWVDENIAFTNRDSYRRTTFGKIALSDPKEALRIFESMLDEPGKAKSCVSILISRVSGDHPEMLLDWFRNQPNENLEAMAPRSPSGNSFHDSGYGASWNKLAEELGPGFEWMKVPEKERIARIEWPVSDLKEARSFISNELPRIGVFGNSNLQWTPEAMDQTIDMLKDSGELEAADTYEIAKVWARSDPQTAFEWASELDAALRIGTSEAALGAWFAAEPVKARAYVDSLPNSEFRRYAVERVATDWLESSPEQAVKWINQMPQGIDKDIGKREIATTFRHRNPKRAYFNANAISHPVIRDEALEKVFEVWFRQDAEAATEYLNKANLPAERRTEIGGR